MGNCGAFEGTNKLVQFAIEVDFCLNYVCGHPDWSKYGMLVLLISCYASAPTRRNAGEKVDTALRFDGNNPNSLTNNYEIENPHRFGEDLIPPDNHPVSITVGVSKIGVGHPGYESFLSHKLPLRMNQRDVTAEDSVKENTFSENQAMFSALTIQDSILPRIWVGVLVSTTWSAILTVLYMNDKTRFTPYILDPLLIDILGLVLGLLLSFRADTSYERYIEGRQIFSKIQAANRYVSTLVWLYIDRVEANEKLCLLNMVLALSVATKHHLRGEHGLLFDDLQPLLGHLPAGSFTNDLDIPHQISIQLSHHLKDISDRGEFTNNALELVSDDVFDMLSGKLQSMVKCIDRLKRIQNCPTPLGFGLHLR